MNEHLPIWGFAILSLYNAVAITAPVRECQMLAHGCRKENIPVGFTPHQKPNTGTRLGWIERPVAGVAEVSQAT